jgi:hypothetical protein
MLRSFLKGNNEEEMECKQVLKGIKPRIDFAWSICGIGDQEIEEMN